MTTTVNRAPLPPSNRRGTFHEKDAEKLIKQWSASPKTPLEALAIVKMAQSFDYGSVTSRETMQTFLDEQLPKLVQPDSKDVANRDFVKDFASKAWAGPMDKASAKALVKTWEANAVPRPGTGARGRYQAVRGGQAGGGQTEGPDTRRRRGRSEGAERVRREEAADPGEGIPMSMPNSVG